MKLVALIGVVTTALTLAACDARSHLVGSLGALADGGTLADAPASDGPAVEGGTMVQPVDASVGIAPVRLAISPRDALTRVARRLWGEDPPDSALLALADSGAVTTNADVRKIALDMLADPRARVGVANFYRWWLELERVAKTQKDPQVFPEYSSSVAAMTASETESFAVDVTLTGDGRFATLMQASYSFLNETLASLYGVAGVMGTDLRKVELDPTQRAGIFTHLSMLAISSNPDSWTSPTRRGAFIVRKMLCADVPPPPPEVEFVIDPPPPDSSLTNRQRLERRASATECVNCHRLFDPLGFAYETFDSIGRVRLTDSGLPIDARGQLIASGGAALPFNGAIELAAILATLPDAHRCMGNQWLEYMLGRRLTPQDGPSVTGIYDLFLAGNRNLRALIAAAASSPSFLAPQCTPGLDQTCSDNPAANPSMRGTCTSEGKCICNPDAVQNPESGRCK